MALIPRFLLRHTITIEPFTGQGGNGPTYGPAVTVRCFRDDTRRRVLNALGEQVLSGTTCYTGPGVTAPPLSRVTGLPSGVPAYVINAKLRSGGGMPTPDHLEVSLT